MVDDLQRTDATADVHVLFFLQEHGIFNRYKCCVKKYGMHSSVLVKIGTNYPQALIILKLMKFTVVYTAM